MESRELQELRVQIALGLITDQDLWQALNYPNRRAPGEKVCQKRIIEDTTTIFTHLIHRKYIIDLHWPNDILRFIVKRVKAYRSKRT